LAIREMRSVQKELGSWIKELENPTVSTSSGAREAYPGGIPEGLSVGQVTGIPVEQFRAELAVLAAKLEAIAST